MRMPLSAASDEPIAHASIERASGRAPLSWASGRSSTAARLAPPSPGRQRSSRGTHPVRAVPEVEATGRGVREDEPARRNGVDRGGDETAEGVAEERVQLLPPEPRLGKPTRRPGENRTPLPPNGPHLT